MFAGHLTRFGFKRLMGMGVCLFVLGVACPSAARTFETGQTGVQLLCQGQPLRYTTQSVMVLPRELVRVEVEGNPSESYTLSAPKTLHLRKTKQGWQGQAPATSGVYPVEISSSGTQEKIVLHVWVLVPYTQLRQGRLNQYRIGKYPKPKTHGQRMYSHPRGFIQVTAQNAELPVSPHFILKQFVCKQNKTYPAYVVLDERLILKLERILARLNAKGYACSTLQLLSGYRTPYYNRKIGNVRYSSHVWGRAADIYVDEDLDGNMDDLNGDQQVDSQDAAILAEVVEAMDNGSENPNWVGGLGLYEKTEDYGPFVHVDVRGQKARWGLHFNTLVAVKHQADAYTE